MQTPPPFHRQTIPNSLKKRIIKDEMAKMGKDRKKESLEAKKTEDAANSVENKNPVSTKRSSKAKRQSKKKKAVTVGRKADEPNPADEAKQERPEGDVDSSATGSSDREPIEDQTEQPEITSEFPDALLNSYVSELSRTDRSEHGHLGSASATNLKVGEQLSLGIVGTEAEESPEHAARRHLKRVVESLIFVSDKPISVAQIRKTARARTAEVTSILKELVQDYQDRGIELMEVGGGYIFRSAPECASFVRDLVAQRPVRLSQAQLETLSIVAYRQPVTRPEIEEIRGVDTGSAIKVLLDRGLLKMLGRKDEPGRPLHYGTTPYFLEFFGMKNLKDLPTLREFSDLNEENRELFKRKTGESLEEAKNALFASSAPSDLDRGASEQSNGAEVGEDVPEEETREPIVGLDEDSTDQESEFEPLNDQEVRDVEETSHEQRDDLEEEFEQEREHIDYDDL
jgi:segregation and condensation protein B